MNCTASPSTVTYHLRDITVRIQVYCLLPIKIIRSSYFVQVFTIKHKFIKRTNPVFALYNTVLTYYAMNAQFKDSKH